MEWEVQFGIAHSQQITAHVSRDSKWPHLLEPARPPKATEPPRRERSDVTHSLAVAMGLGNTSSWDPPAVGFGTHRCPWELMKPH